MAYSKSEWEVVKAFFEEGLSLAEIVARPEVAIKDRSSISRRATKEGWIKGKNATLTATEIQIKQSHAEIVEKKSTLNATALEIHNTIVDERTKHIQFFTDSTMRNMKSMMVKIGDESSINEHRVAQAALKDAKEVVIGKMPDTAIQINNNGNDKPLTLADFYAGNNG